MKLEELQSIIDKADSAYYTTGQSIMEDARYDKLKDELKRLNPSDVRLLSVGSTIKNNILRKVKHNIPMGSLSKSTNEQEWNDWLKNNIVKVGVNSTELFHASYKMDGGSFSLTYKDGRLVEAISRGDGTEGEDITANAIHFKGVPPVVSYNGKLFSGYVRGEVVLTNGDWLIVDPNKDSNPRNLAVGIARRKDGSQSEYLTFYAFRMFNDNGIPIGDTEENMSKTLSNIGFQTVKYFVGNSNDVWNWYLEVGKARQTLNFWIDGIVAKVNNLKLQLSLGESSNCPKSQNAIKFEAEGATTVLRNVTLQVGHTGAIAPVANFDPVRIGGTTITNATLCNWENIETLDVAIGDKILVIKAGDIIPRIMEVVEKGKTRKTITMPTCCPVCNEKVARRDNISGEESAAIYCVNELCPSIVSGRIEKYLKSLDIQSGGDSLIQALINDMGVKDPSDLYLLHKNRKQLADLILSGKVRFGEKRADKFIEEIEKKRTIPLSDFLGSIGIFGLGKRRVTIIQGNLPGELDKLEDWFSDVLVKNAAKAGVRNMAQSIHDELVKQQSYIMKFIKNGLVIGQPVPKQQLAPGAFIMCITGALSKPKSFFQAMIESAGHGYTETFSKTVTHLVTNDPSSGSSKLVKAQKQGTKIISEKELLDIIGTTTVIITTPTLTNSPSNQDNPWFN